MTTEISLESASPRSNAQASDTAGSFATGSPQLRSTRSPFVPACAGPQPGSASLSPSRPRTELCFPAPRCLGLRSPSGATYPAQRGDRHFNIIPPSTPLSLCESASLRVLRSPCSRPASRPPRPASLMRCADWCFFLKQPTTEHTDGGLYLRLSGKSSLVPYLSCLIAPSLTRGSLPFWAPHSLLG